MTLLYYAPIFQEHHTGDHPECPERLATVSRHLQWVGLDAACRRPEWTPCSLEQLSLVHMPSYVKDVESFAQRGGGWIEQDTLVSPGSYRAACWAAGAVCNAVERVVAGEDQRAFCLVRPPGHHALPGGAMGFCLFNNIAVGARLATAELGLDRVLIVDWDVHHGNGTQAAFWQDGRVGFLSIHRSPFYPGEGAAAERGEGAGWDTTMNLPVAADISRDDYLTLFRDNLQQFARRIAPQLILVSAGFDAHRDDPIGSLGLEEDDFREMTRIVLTTAHEYAEGRLVSVLEGGYDLDALTDCVEVHLEELTA